MLRVKELMKKIGIFVYIPLLIACSSKQTGFDVQIDTDSISASQQKQWNEVANIDPLTYPLSEAFFAQWQQLSDKYAASHPSPNISHVYQRVFMHFCDSNSGYSYYVLPPCVLVRKYSSEFDTKYYSSHTWASEDYFQDAQEFSYIPHLHTNKSVLYLFEDVEKVLGEYLGGVKDKSRKDINQEHVDDLHQYIDLHYGHWGGYWHIETMPIISHMYFFNNGIYISLRDSWCTGKEIFMPYQSDAFIEIGSWME